MLPNDNVPLQELALRDPIAAYGRLLGMLAKPVSFNAQAKFSSFALNQVPIVEPLDEQLQSRTWIDNATFELQIPNAFVGSVFLPTALKDLKASPGVSVRIQVMSGPRELITPNFTPLENFATTDKVNWLRGTQIARNQQIQTEFMLTAIPFNDSSNTPPYIINMTYNCWQFDDGCCDEITCAEAQAILCKAGIITARTLGVRTVYCAGA